MSDLLYRNLRPFFVIGHPVQQMIPEPPALAGFDIPAICRGHRSDGVGYLTFIENSCRRLVEIQEIRLKGPTPAKGLEIRSGQRQPVLPIKTCAPLSTTKSEQLLKQLRKR